jgi:hypothetical protein
MTQAGRHIKSSSAASQICAQRFKPTFVGAAIQASLQ